MAENTGFPEAHAPNNTAVPKITNIFDLSAEALGGIRTWLEQNPFAIPITQIQGFSQYAAQADHVAAEAHTTSAVYADPNVSGGVGPTLSNLPDGKYVVLFGGSGGGDFAHNVTYHMGISVNGVVPSDDTTSAEWGSDRGNTSGAMAALATLAGGGTNTIKAVYRSSDGTDRGNVRYRWVVVFKYSN